MRICIQWLALALILVSGTASAKGAAAGPLVIATYHYPRYDRTAALEPLRKLIEAHLGRPARIVLAPTPDALAADIRAHKVDIALPNLAAWLAVADDRRVSPIASLDVPAATRDRYRGVLLARAGTVTSGALLAAQVRTLRYATVLPGSTSGALVQAGYLRTLGIAPTDFAAQISSGTHDAALGDLFAGRADIAALAEEPWRNLKAGDPTRAGQLVELWRSRPIPAGPVLCVARNTTPCAQIADLLTAPTPAARAAAQSVAAGWSETEGAGQFLRYDAAQFSELDGR